VKVSFPFPGGTSNTLGVEDDGKILLGAWKQACYPTPANVLQGPGSRFQFLQGVAANIFIMRPYQVFARDEGSSPDGELWPKKWSKVDFGHARELMHVTDLSLSTVLRAEEGSGAIIPTAHHRRYPNHIRERAKGRYRR